MADERELIEEREKKAAEIRALGGNPYANGFSPTHTASEIIARFADAPPPPEATEKGAPPSLISDEHFKLAGRIVAYRGFGKAAFVKLLDRTGEIQLWIRKDLIGDTAFELWKRAERGDFIGVVGSPTKTKTGELTIVAENVVLLTKATRPLPEKWHGLSDVEVRYRQRYVDLV
ncbi:MAG: OB-fold nucleic acid binding domain-containing protein, partial [Verrucomicrobiota bacterium]